MRYAFGIVVAGIAISHAAVAAPVCWAPMPENSTLSFSVTQAGAALQGTFKSYTASVCLDAADATKDQVKLAVQLVSVDTQLPELDEALRGADFFDVPHWPQASFVSDSVKSLSAGHYAVTGKLTIRDVTRVVTVPFSWQPAVDGKSAKLDGHMSLQRLDYKIGQGQWADTQWVGNQVDVSISAVFKPTP